MKQEDFVMTFDECRDLYISGETVAELSRKSGIAEETLRRKLVASGCPMRKRGQPHGKHLPSGGKTLDKHGYVLVICPPGTPGRRESSGYIPEHRLVMQNHLGRALLPGEVVHHINGVKSDNRIENLQLYAEHSEHFRDHLMGNQYWKLRQWRNPHLNPQPESNPEGSDTDALE